MLKAQAAPVSPARQLPMRSSVTPPRDSTIGGLRYAIDSLMNVQARTGPSQRGDAHLADTHRLLARQLSPRDSIASLIAHRDALRYARSSGDSIIIAEAAYSLGIEHWSRNHYDSALVHLQHARTMRVALGDSASLGPVLNSIGSTYYQMANYEPALDAFMESLERRRRDGDAAAISRVLTNIGKTYQDWGQFERAMPIFTEAVDFARKATSPATLGYALNSLGALFVDLRQFDRARALFRESQEAYVRGIETDSASGWALNGAATGLLLLREGRPREALPVLQSVHSITQRGGSARGRARILLHLGQTHAALGDADLAVSTLLQSAQISKQISQRVLTLQALEQLALVEEKRGQSRAALQHLRDYQALRDTIFNQATAQRVAAMEARAETHREQMKNEGLRADQVNQSLVIQRQRQGGVLGVIILALGVALLIVLVRFNRKGRAREAVLARANEELRTALSEVRALKGLIPICASCKKVRDDQGYWEAVETYISSRSDLLFSHSICQTCGPTLYGELWQNEEAQENAADRAGPM